jgi:hypothetical protein
VAEADGAEGRAVAETEFTLLVATAEGLMPAVAVVPVAAVVGLVVGVATGRGWDIGVSYRIYIVVSFLFVVMRICCRRTEAMNRPNMAPRPPPMTPAIIVLPRQDSMPICIYAGVSRVPSSCSFLSNTSPSCCRVFHLKFVKKVWDRIPLSPSAVPALTCQRWGSWRQA